MPKKGLRAALVEVEADADGVADAAKLNGAEAPAMPSELALRDRVQLRRVHPGAIPPRQPRVRIDIDVGRARAGGAGHLHDGHRPQTGDKGIAGEYDARARPDGLGELHVPHVSAEHRSAARHHGLGGHLVAVRGDSAHRGLCARPVEVVVFLGQRGMACRLV